MEHSFFSAHKNLESLVSNNIAIMNHLSEDYLFNKSSNSKNASPIKLVMGKKKR